MPIELIGFISPLDQSETHDSAGPLIDRPYMRRLARAHEDAGFDRALVGYWSSGPDNLQVVAWAAAQTERLAFLLAHRPGTVHPTSAARAFATLDQLSDGRVALHAVNGPSDVEQRREGDWVEKQDRYARSAEYLQLLKRAWTEEEPFDFDGRFYRVRGFHSEVRPYQQPHIPLFFSGSSDEAYVVGAAEADVFALFGQPLAQVREEIDRIKAAARAVGRAEPPQVSVSFRPIVGATEQEAWERAHAIRDAAARHHASGAGQRGWLAGNGTRPAGTPWVGAERQLAAAAAGERHDRALWTAIATATGASGGNSTALVGTAETVAEALLDYVDLGATKLLIRGFDPLQDVIDWGRELIPRLRAGVVERERAAVGRADTGGREQLTA